MSPSGLASREAARAGKSRPGQVDGRETATVETAVAAATSTKVSSRDSWPMLAVLVVPEARSHFPFRLRPPLRRCAARCEAEA